MPGMPSLNSPDREPIQSCGGAGLGAGASDAALDEAAVDAPFFGSMASGFAFFGSLASGFDFLTGAASAAAVAWAAAAGFGSGLAGRLGLFSAT